MSRPLARSDEEVVRAAGRRVGFFLAAATSALVILAVTAMVIFVLRRLHSPDRDPADSIDVDVPELLFAAVVIGLLAIIVAAITSSYATRRAVAPLAQALRLQRDFVADASHELRTPLAVLDTRIQLLQRKDSHASDVRDALAEIRGETQTLTAIVNDLLLASEIDEPRATPSSVHRVVASTVESLHVLADERDVAIVAQKSAADIRVAVPPVALQRALTALLDNAIKHAPAGTEVSVITRADARQCRISVVDHGAGIRGIDPERLFDRFARGTREEPRSGRGIGLALVRDTARRYGGEVRLVQGTGQGTEFLLELPVETQRALRHRIADS